MKKYLKTAAFVLYFAVVLRITVFRTSGYDSYAYNFALFSDLFANLKEQGIWRFVYLFVGNIVWFVPFGVFLPSFSHKNKICRVLACGFAFTLFIETSQLLSKKGVFELDDLILNTFGVACGYRIYLLYKKAAALKNKQQ